MLALTFPFDAMGHAQFKKKKTLFFIVVYFSEVKIFLSLPSGLWFS